MRRRSLLMYGVLLLCIIMAGCSKRNLETSDELITEDYDINIDNEAGINGDAVMTVKENPNKNSLEANEQEPYVNNLVDNIPEAAGSIDNNDPESDSSVENMPVDTTLNETEEKDALVIRPDTYSAGTIIDTAGFTKEMLDSLFYIKEIDQEIIDRIYGKSYKEDSDIPYSDLRYIHLLHIGFDGLTHVGELIVNKAIAEDIIDIFKELYAIEYPIEKMLLIDEYDADDNKSMADNNSSCFNYRSVPGTNRRSVHSDGRAIDINPLYNPYIRTKDGELEILPENGREYADRDIDNPYYIRKDDICYNAFISRGFSWGGEWKNSKDYQHFEKKASD